MQIMWDLLGVAEALAAVRRDDESLEVAGTAESQGAEIGAAQEALYVEHLKALEQRSGPPGRQTSRSAAEQLTPPTALLERANSPARTRQRPPSSTSDKDRIARLPTQQGGKAIQALRADASPSG